jgi:hypothetical protein
MADMDDRDPGGSDSDRDADRDRDRMQGNQRNPGSNPSGGRGQGTPGSQPGQGGGQGAPGSDVDDDEPGMGMPERKERQRSPDDGAPSTDRSNEDEDNPAE